LKCTSPLAAYRLANGDVSFVERGDVVQRLDLPWGKCTSCRITRSEEWAIRVMHEAKVYDHTCFLTLTYADEHLPNPPSLHHEHFQKFMRRLRKRFGKVRFFMCGEYGTDTFRPHFHAAIFGVDFLADRKVYKGRGERTIYESSTLNELWGHGHCTIGRLTHQSAAYIARYIMQKRFISNFSPPEIRDHYKRVDLNTGEITELAPEYIRMSLKPGIGGTYFERYGGDIYPHDAVIVDGRPRKPPRYYDKLRARQDFDLIERVKMVRQERAREHAEDNSDAMLAMQDEWLKHALKQTKQRPLR
jgi:hypothetical protein